MKPILIVKAGATFTDMAARCGDFDDCFKRHLDSSAGPIETVSPYLGERLPQPHALGGIIITGSHDMVTDKHPWSEKTAEWIRQAVDHEIPLLGVCYGHQLLAHALGGEVGDNPRGKEYGSVALRLNGLARQDPLFEALPESIYVQACHSQSVLKLPAGSVLLGSSDMDPHHAFAVGRQAWGVQFHPEFGVEMLRLYIQRFADELRAQGRNVDRLLGDLRETPLSHGLLRRFQRLCI
jgi:GMP synthase (glutamine-hydrolysing)